MWFLSYHNFTFVFIYYVSICYDCTSQYTSIHIDTPFSVCLCLCAWEVKPVDRLAKAKIKTKAKLYGTITLGERVMTWITWNHMPGWQWDMFLQFSFPTKMAFGHKNSICANTKQNGEWRQKKEMRGKNQNIVLHPLIKKSDPYIEGVQCSTNR